MRRPALDRGLLAIADCSRLFRGLPIAHLKSQRGRRGSRILCNYGVCGISPTAALSNLFYDGGLYLRCWWVKLDGRGRTASRDRCSGRKYPTSVKTCFWEFRHSLVLIGVTPADDFVQVHPAHVGVGSAVFAGTPHTFEKPSAEVSMRASRF